MYIFACLFYFETPFTCMYYIAGVATTWLAPVTGAAHACRWCKKPLIMFDIQKALAERMK
jgi:hypothetical protein